MIDSTYQRILRSILDGGIQVETRNHRTFKHTAIPEIWITETPLITLRKTAWRKALLEWEWFMSGEAKCPEALLDWWDGQLSVDGRYLDGYGEQLRHATDADYSVDQISDLIAGLREHPNSRRHVVTTWNAAAMANITRTNQNSKTPTCCHGTIVQFHVVGEYLYMYHYQRSADVLLGLPHNLMQYWAFLLFVAHHTGYEPGRIAYKLGDAHIYDEKSHLSAARAILEAPLPAHVPQLRYCPTEEAAVFKASDFSLSGEVPKPATNIRPTLL
jgi:thymidylate synthase